MKTVGIYLGSFNPIHIGHLAIANWFCEFGPIDELWFVVTPLNPFKKQGDLLDDEMRLHLTQQAVGDYSKMRVCDIEMHLPKPNYTIDTMKALQQMHPNCRFVLMLGADNWQSFAKWFHAEELLQAFPIYVYPRKGYEVVIATQYNQVSLVNAPEIEISSTFIRQSIRTGRDVRFFLPESIRSEAVRLLKKPDGIIAK